MAITQVVVFSTDLSYKTPLNHGKHNLAILHAMSSNLLDIGKR